MAAVLSNVAIYDQYDFIPNQLLMDFANTGYVLKPVFEWLSVPEDLAYAVVATVGCQLEPWSQEQTSAAPR